MSGLNRHFAASTVIVDAQTRAERAGDALVQTKASGEGIWARNRASWTRLVTSFILGASEVNLTTFWFSKNSVKISTSIKIFGVTVCHARFVSFVCLFLVLIFLCFLVFLFLCSFFLFLSLFQILFLFFRFIVLHF